MKSDSVYIAQILDSISKIRSFTDGYTRGLFFKDQKTQSAVIMQLALIGELAKKVSSDIRAKTSIPWSDIAGFRDRAIHHYYEVDLSIVWDTVMNDLKILEDGLKHIK